MPIVLGATQRRMTELGRFVGINDDRDVAYDLARAQLSFSFEIPYFRALLEPLDSQPSPTCTS